MSPPPWPPPRSTPRPDDARGPLGRRVGAARSAAVVMRSILGDDTTGGRVEGPVGMPPLTGHDNARRPRPTSSVAVRRRHPPGQRAAATGPGPVSRTSLPPRARPARSSARGCRARAAWPMNVLPPRLRQRCSMFTEPVPAPRPSPTPTPSSTIPARSRARSLRGRSRPSWPGVAGHVRQCFLDHGEQVPRRRRRSSPCRWARSAARRLQPSNGRRRPPPTGPGRAGRHDAADRRRAGRSPCAVTHHLLELAEWSTRRN